MWIETKNHDGVHVVAVEGKLDTNASPRFEAHLDALVEGGARRVVVDLGALSFVTSSGLRVMLKTAKQLRAQSGDLGVCNLSPMVREIFDISGFNIVLPVFDSLEDAIEG